MLLCIRKNKKRKLISLLIIIIIFSILLCYTKIAQFSYRKIIPLGALSHKELYSAGGFQDITAITEYKYSARSDSIFISSPYYNKITEEDLEIIHEKIKSFQSLSVYDDVSFLDSILSKITLDDWFYYKEINERDFELGIYLIEEHILYFFDES